MRVYIESAGCEQRGIEAQRIIDYLETNKVEIVSSPQSCDYAILLTCGVDKSNEDNSIGALESILKRLPSSSKIILGGCLPSINPPRLARYEISGTFSPSSLENIDSILGIKIQVPFAQIENPNYSISDNLKNNNLKNTNIARQEYENAKRGFKIKINEGCLLSCSYCNIKKATGKLKSEPSEKIIEQYVRARTLKEPTVMLMGGDTGAYGRDINSGLPDLLKELLHYSDGPKIFIHDFNVNWLIGDITKYDKVFSKSECLRRIKSVTFPIQSGSDRILKLMRRPYTSRGVTGALKTVKKISPSLKIGTHVIVGFPSESELDFQSTLDIIGALEFDFVSCFAYSENEFTDSSKLEGKIEKEVIRQRLRMTADLFKNKVKVFEC